MLAVIYFVTACFCIPAFALSDEAVFSLSLVSVKESTAVIAVGLESGKFSSADIRLNQFDENTVCKNISYTTLFNDLCDKINDCGGTVIREKNAAENAVSVASDNTFETCGDYFLFEFNISPKDTINKYDFYMVADSVNYSVKNNLPDDPTEHISAPFTYIIRNNKAIITGYNGTTEEKINVPNEFDGIPVTEIYPFAFSNCKKIKSVTLPESLTVIGSHAFADCTKLTEIKISDNIKTICNSAFENCSALASVTLPDGLEAIGSSAFSGCSALKKVSFGKNLKSIGEYGFFDCASLTEAILPDSVKNLGMYAFGKCYALSTVKTGNNISEIEPFTFTDCCELKNITFGNTLTTIKYGAFDKCCQIQNVYFGGSSDNWDKVCVEERNEFLLKCKVTCNIYYYDGHYCTILSETKPDCITDGKLGLKCIDCGKTFSITTPAFGHSFSDRQIEKYPNIGEQGRAVCECERCHEKVTEKIEALTGYGVVDGSFIYGFSYGNSVEQLSDAVDFPEAEVKIDKTFDGLIATGSVVTAHYPQTGITLKYETVFFGDVNCDGEYNAMDSIYIACINAGMLDKDKISEVQYMAADCDHSGKVDEKDVALLNYVSLYNKKIDQTIVPMSTIHSVNEKSVVDEKEKVLYGISQGLTSLDGYFETNKQEFYFRYSTPVIGTGTVIDVMCCDEVIDSYTAVLYGDVNGDGYCDGIDAVLTSCIAEKMLSASDIILKAADVNHDGEINGDDADIISSAGIGLCEIKQTF